MIQFHIRAIIRSLLFCMVVPAHAADFVPQKTLAQEIDATKVQLKPNYLKTRPRLLYSPADKVDLTQKTSDQPVLWKSVLASSSRLKTTPDTIAQGKTYYRIEGVQSAALDAFVTGSASAKKRAIESMLAHVAEPIWGTDYRPNLDLVASWYLYHIAIAYDSLYNDLNDADRVKIRDGLIAHAKAIFEGFDPAQEEKIRYDQNHTYIPAVAMVTAALALQGETPDAEQWLKRGVAIMNRCRYALGTDGYYYEGVSYWGYALHWHVRYADLMSRATGQKLATLPALAQTWRYGLHLSLPGAPGNFDIGDSGRWEGNARPTMRVNNHAMLWGLAGMLDSPQSMMVGDFYQSRNPERDYPAAAFLWHASDVKPATLSEQTPYHHFVDHDVLTWRSGWDDDATCLWFRAGPPLGHAANHKLKQMTDWTINAGHVHPDIGAFLLYAKKTYLAVTTGYTAEKWTKDHNTLLVDGQGQGVDGSYWNERGIPYDQLNDTKIEQAYVSNNYAYANGSIGSAYTRQVAGVQLNRRLLITKRYLLLIDDLKSDAPRSLTWLCHANAPFKLVDGNQIATLPTARLAVIQLTAGDCDVQSEPTIVMAGTKPGPGTPTQRAHHLSITPKTKSTNARMVNLLVPLDLDQPAPKVDASDFKNNQVHLTLVWAEGKREAIQLDLNWSKTDQSSSPAVIEIK